MGDPHRPNDESDDEVDYDNPPFPLTATDRELLAMKDEDYRRITWDDLRSVLAANNLDALKRTPRDLRRYLAWTHRTKKAYSNMTSFVITERLFWEPLSSSSSPHQDEQQQQNKPPRFAYSSPIPFASRTDYAILPNDWPYGFTEDITHLLVWSKTPIAVDLASGGDVTMESRRVIEEFVRRQFAVPLGGCSGGDGDGGERVFWFKNWVALQSVRGVDHVHVLVRNAPRELVKEWTRRVDLV